MFEYSDTHFHFQTLTEERQQDAHVILKELLDTGCVFGLDIGTFAGDLEKRKDLFSCAVQTFCQEERKRLLSMLHFAAGVWPWKNAVENRTQEIKKLQESIQKTSVSAIGECGLDYHLDCHIGSGKEYEGSAQMMPQMQEGQKELFCLQLELAKKMSLPFIVHSRDAFCDTLSCLKQVGYFNGVIHCFGYGKKEAKAFLDLGLYISFSGSTTYTKKRDMEEKKETLLSISKDRILFETDAPFLAPVPHRGQVCHPCMTTDVIRWCASLMQKDEQELSGFANENAKRLFSCPCFKPLH